MTRDDRNEVDAIEQAHPRCSNAEHCYTCILLAECREYRARECACGGPHYCESEVAPLRERNDYWHQRVSSLVTDAELLLEERDALRERVGVLEREKEQDLYGLAADLSALREAAQVLLSESERARAHDVEKMAFAQARVSALLPPKEKP